MGQRGPYHDRHHEWYKYANLSLQRAPAQRSSNVYLFAGLSYLPAPKAKVPSHEDSYNPPFEYRHDFSEDAQDGDADVGSRQFYDALRRVRFPFPPLRRFSYDFSSSHVLSFGIGSCVFPIRGREVLSLCEVLTDLLSSCFRFFPGTFRSPFDD